MRTIALLIVLAAAAAAQEETEAERLYREGWWQETGSGDLPEALALYERARVAPGPDGVKARATLRTAILTQRLGEEATAIRLLERLIEEFPAEDGIVEQARLHLGEWTAIDLRQSYGEWYRRHLFSPEFQKRVVEWVFELGAGNPSERSRAARKLLSAGEAAVPALNEALRSGNTELKRNAVDLLLTLGRPPAASDLLPRDGLMGAARFWVALLEQPAAVRARLLGELPWRGAVAAAFRAALDSPAEALEFLSTPEGLRFGSPWEIEDEEQEHRGLALLEAALQVGGRDLEPRLCELAVDSALPALLRSKATELALGSNAWAHLEPLARLEWARASADREEALAQLARHLRPAEEALFDALLGLTLTSDGSSTAPLTYEILRGFRDNPRIDELPWTVERARTLVAGAAISTRAAYPSNLLTNMASRRPNCDAFAEALLLELAVRASMLRGNENVLRWVVYEGFAVDDGTNTTTWGRVLGETIARYWDRWGDQVKAEVLERLLQAGAPVTLPRRFVEVARDHDQPARLRVALLRALEGAAITLASLQASLNLMNTDDLRAAIELLPQLPADAATLSAFSQGLRMSDNRVRWALVYHYRGGGTLDEHIAAFAPLIELSDRNTRVAIAEYLAAWRSGDALGYLMKAALDDDPTVRHYAALGLTHNGSPAALETLHRLMEDPSADVRTLAAEGAAAIQGEMSNRQILRRQKKALAGDG